MEARIGQQTRFGEYSAWLKLRWMEWRRVNGIPQSEALTYAHYRAFDAWLALRSARSQLDSGSARAA